MDNERKEQLHNPSILEIEHLFMKYKGSENYTNEDITLSINRGEIVGLLGPNGAGKTTLVRQISGTLRPSSGSIYLDGTDLVKNPGIVTQKMASLSQVMYAQRFLKVEEFISYTGVYRGLGLQDSLYQANQFMEYFKIEDMKDRLISVLSGGQQRVVGFISALIGLRPLIILDEPTNDVDPERRILLWQLVKEIKQTYGISFLLVTHNIYEAQDVVDRVVIIQNGKLGVEGIPADLIRDMKIPIKIKFSLPFNREVPEWLVNKKDFQQLDQECCQIEVSEDALNETLIELFSKEKSEEIKNIEIIKPSLADAYISSTKLQ